MIAFDPNQTVTVTLDSDADRPPAERPGFVFRHATCRQALRRRELLDKAGDTLASDAEAVRLLSEALALTFVRAERIPDGGDACDLASLVTPMELWELAYKCQSAASLAEIELKKSVSQSRSGSAGFANDAAPAAA